MLQMVVEHVLAQIVGTKCLLSKELDFDEDMCSSGRDCNYKDEEDFLSEETPNLVGHYLEKRIK